MVTTMMATSTVATVATAMVGATDDNQLKAAPKEMAVAVAAHWFGGSDESSDGGGDGDGDGNGNNDSNGDSDGEGDGNSDSGGNRKATVTVAAVVAAAAAASGGWWNTRGVCLPQGAVRAQQQCP